MQAGVFEAIAHDLRIVERVLKERDQNPSAVIFDGRTLPSMPESGSRAGYDGAKRKNGSKIHVAVETLGKLLALTVTPGNVQEREQVGELAQKIKELADGRVKLAYVDQGYPGERAAKAAVEHEIELEVVKHTEAKKGFVLLPRRWVVERTFGWLGRHRRLARDYERLAKTLAANHWVAYLGIMIQRIFN